MTRDNAGRASTLPGPVASTPGERRTGGAFAVANHGGGLDVLGRDADRAPGEAIVVRRTGDRGERSHPHLHLSGAGHLVLAAEALEQAVGQDVDEPWRETGLEDETLLGAGRQLDHLVGLADVLGEIGIVQPVLNG